MSCITCPTICIKYDKPKFNSWPLHHHYNFSHRFQNFYSQDKILRSLLTSHRPHIQSIRKSHWLSKFCKPGSILPSLFKREILLLANRPLETLPVVHKTTLLHSNCQWSSQSSFCSFWIEILKMQTPALFAISSQLFVFHLSPWFFSSIQEGNHEKDKPKLSTSDTSGASDAAQGVQCMGEFFSPRKGGVNLTQA